MQKVSFINLTTAFHIKNNSFQVVYIGHYKSIHTFCNAKSTQAPLIICWLFFFFFFFSKFENENMIFKLANF